MHTNSTMITMLCFRIKEMLPFILHSPGFLHQLHLLHAYLSSTVKGSRIVSYFHGYTCRLFLRGMKKPQSVSAIVIAACGDPPQIWAEPNRIEGDCRFGIRSKLKGVWGDERFVTLAWHCRVSSAFWHKITTDNFSFVQVKMQCLQSWISLYYNFKP